MMATRKLKFKPKPILGNNIRRLPTRDNDEISIPTSVTTEKEPSTAIASFESIKASGESDTGTSILSTTNTEQKGEHVNSSNSISNGESPKEISDSNMLQLPIQVNHPAPINETVITNLLPSTSELQNEPESSSSDCQPPSTDCETKTTQNQSDNKEENNMDTGTSGTIKNSPLPAKVDGFKGLSRFGRSRCKPVLTSVPRRNITRISSDETKSDSASAVEGTVSVIKSVQSEVSEINESEVNTLSNSNKSDDINACEKESDIINTTTIETKLQDTDKSSTSESAPDNATATPTQVTSKDEVISETCNQTRSPNQPTKDIVESNKNANEFECSNARQSAQILKVALSPLRTTSKIRAPKPSPRIKDGIRRLSFQGSDSEEDFKRKRELTDSRDKKDNVKTTKRKKSHGSTYSKMGMETLQKFHEKFGKDEKPDKSKLTMMDLIFYNPKDNPMSKTQPKVNSSVAKKEIKTDVNEEISETLAEQSVDDVEASPSMPVPQLKIGPDGQIMLDPKSLVIETTGTKKNREELEKSQVIQESGITRYSTYSKRKRRRSDWSDVETLQFYRVLSTIGPDFTLMTQLFPKRSRHDIKLKFKKEDRINRVLIDKAMTGQVDFDFKLLQEELRRENEEIEKRRQQKEQHMMLQKEEKLKRKAEKKKMTAERNENKKNIMRKRRRKTACSTEILDTDEDVSGEESRQRKQDAIMKMANSKRPVYKRLKKPMSDDEDEDEVSPKEKDEVSPKEKDEVSPKEEDKLSLKEDISSQKLRLVKKTRKLNEYHEMNESLKKKIEDLETEDQYTPNGPEADDLFKSPSGIEERTDDPWNIDLSSVPPIEESVLQNNIETVSEISELGSFGQDSDLVLDLSMTGRTLENRPYLDRRIISESMAIVEQLSSHAENKIEETSKTDNENAPVLPLPGFETVIGTRPSFRYVLDDSEIVTHGDAECMEIRTNCEELNVSDFQGQSQYILGD